MLIHSVDKPDLAREIDRQAAKCGRDSVGILLQVNTAREEQKGGVSPEELAALYAYCKELEHLKVRGLMCMAPNTSDEGITDARHLFDDLRAQDEEIQILSMGMSHDAHIALEEGSTLVRLGTSIFGRREGYGPETEAIK